MKRTLSLALCLILSLALLAGCGAAPLPDGLTQESVTDAAAQTVAQLNDEDYDALFAGMTEEMTSAMTAEDLAAVCQCGQRPFPPYGSRCWKPPARSIPSQKRPWAARTATAWPWYRQNMKTPR